MNIWNKVNFGILTKVTTKFLKIVRESSEKFTSYELWKTKSVHLMIILRMQSLIYVLRSCFKTKPLYSNVVIHLLNNCKLTALKSPTKKHQLTSSTTKFKYRCHLLKILSLI